MEIKTLIANYEANDLTKDEVKKNLIRDRVIGIKETLFTMSKVPVNIVITDTNWLGKVNFIIICNQDMVLKEHNNQYTYLLYSNLDQQEARLYAQLVAAGQFNVYNI